ncbi:MAG: hypothetical protein VX640_04115 [Pseudomonadota bacterium]|nr:hypothetical protein [Pseudomonadota bacterium]
MLNGYNKKLAHILETPPPLEERINGWKTTEIKVGGLLSIDDVFRNTCWLSFKCKLEIDPDVSMSGRYRMGFTEPVREQWDWREEETQGTPP